jgi:hypothetical protein
MAEESFLIEVTVKRKNPNSLLVEDDSGDEVWIPISQIMFDSEITEDSEPGDTGKLVVSKWIAEDRGWV